MFQKIYNYYCLFVAGWCLCNIVWLLCGNDTSLVSAIVTIILVGIQIIAPTIYTVYKFFKE